MSFRTLVEFNLDRISGDEEFREGDAREALLAVESDIAHLPQEPGVWQSEWLDIGPTGIQLVLDEVSAIRIDEIEDQLIHLTKKCSASMYKLDTYQHMQTEFREAGHNTVAVQNGEGLSVDLVSLMGHLINLADQQRVPTHEYIELMRQARLFLNHHIPCR